MHTQRHQAKRKHNHTLSVLASALDATKLAIVYLPYLSIFLTHIFLVNSTFLALTCCVACAFFSALFHHFYYLSPLIKALDSCTHLPSITQLPPNLQFELYAFSFAERLNNIILTFVTLSYTTRFLIHLTSFGIPLLANLILQGFLCWTSWRINQNDLYLLETVYCASHALDKPVPSILSGTTILFVSVVALLFAQLCLNYCTLPYIATQTLLWLWVFPLKNIHLAFLVTFTYLAAALKSTQNHRAVFSLLTALSANYAVLQFFRTITLPNLSILKAASQLGEFFLLCNMTIHVRSRYCFATAATALVSQNKSNKSADYNITASKASSTPTNHQGLVQ